MTKTMRRKTFTHSDNVISTSLVGSRTISCQSGIPILELIQILQRKYEELENVGATGGKIHFVNDHFLSLTLVASYSTRETDEQMEERRIGKEAYQQKKREKKEQAAVNLLIELGVTIPEELQDKL